MRINATQLFSGSFLWLDANAERVQQMYRGQIVAQFWSGLPKYQMARPSHGTSEHFTGSVRIDPLFTENPPAHMSGSSITFESGARTAWHKHTLGQILIITAGKGWVTRIRGGGAINAVFFENFFKLRQATHIAVYEARRK